VCADRISTCVTPEQIDAFGAQPAKKKHVQKRTLIKTPKPDSKSVLRQSQALFKSSVIWTTPLRLPVVQPYRVPDRQVVFTNMQSFALKEPRLWDPVSKRKQLQGFPPNFIHSLDATHMMLSALKSREKGMTFASIHDSFWTHACDIDKLGELLRDAFVHMHGENIVGRLRQEMIARYDGGFYLATIDAHSAVGKEIKARQTEIVALRKALPEIIKGTKATSVQAELLVERERMRLLASEDAKEREQGQAMLTAASVFAAHANESAISDPIELAESKLGRMPYDSFLKEYDEKGAARSASRDDAVEEGYDNEASASADENEDEDELREEIDGEIDDENANEYDSDGDGDDEPDLSDPQGIKQLLDQDGSDAALARRSNVSRSREAKPAARKTYVWLPLTFPEVPQKGTFDVAQLKQSRYFFH